MTFVTYSIAIMILSVAMAAAMSAGVTFIDRHNWKNKLIGVMLLSASIMIWSYMMYLTIVL